MVSRGHIKTYLFINLILILLNSIRPTLSEDFEHNIEPSLSIFNKDQENLAEWNGMDPQSVVFESVVGKFFNKSILEIAEKYGLGSYVVYSEAQVRVPPSAQEWIVYTAESELIQGVPTNLNIGSFNLFVIIKFKYNDVTIPVRIDVTSDESETSFLTDSDAFEMCAINEPVTALSVSLQHLPTEIDREARISLVLKLSSFFHVDSSAFNFHFSHGNFADDRVFLTGGEGLDVANEEKLTVSWAIGCSSENKFYEIEQLESCARDGSLTKYLGVSVIEWKVVNRISTRSKRMRRAAQRSSNGELFESDGQKGKTTATPIIRGEEVVTLQGRGRTKVQLNLIRNTPMPMAPVMASKMMTHNMVKPMMSSVTYPSTPQTDTRLPNDPPIALFDLPYLEPKTAHFFQFRIPADTFYDKEDGDARHLKLQVYDRDSNKLIEESAAWPRFDKESQELYGVPPMSSEYENVNMLLTAEDSQGTSSTTEFTLNVNTGDKPRARNHKYTFYVSENGDMQDPDDIFLSKFGRKLAIALAKFENNPGSIAIIKTSFASKNNQRVVVWYDEGLNSDRYCYEDEFLRIGTLMVGEDGVEGKNKPDKIFANKFKPEFKLRTIKIEYLGPCSPPTTTEAPTTVGAETDGTTFTEDWEDITTMPPSIIPPPFKSTATVPTTNEVDETTTDLPPPPPMPPKIVVKHLPDYVAETGRASIIKIPMNIFDDSNESEDGLKLEVIGVSGKAVPTWMKLTPVSREILVLPSLDDFKFMDVHNDTYHSYKCGLVARNKNGETSDAIAMQIYVANNEKQSSKYNHEFEVKISNYNVKDFGVDKKWELTKLIAEVFGDGTNTDNVFVHPIRFGSVIFSWHNTTLGSREDCPSDEIAKLANKIFTHDQKFIESVYIKFSQKGFDLEGGSLQKKNACLLEHNVAPTTPDAGGETTAPSPDVKVGSASGSGVIIIAVVIVCLVLLLIILLVKCRLSRLAKKKQKNQENSNAMLDSVSNPKIKKGVPIIFQDEMASNGSAHSEATPLMNSINQSPPYKNNNNDSTLNDSRLIESTPLNQSTVAGTPMTGKRTPPPYHPR